MCIRDSNYGGVDAEYITPDNDEELAASLIGDAGDWGLTFCEADEVDDDEMLKVVEAEHLLGDAVKVAFRGLWK